MDQTKLISCWAATVSSTLTGAVVAMLSASNFIVAGDEPPDRTVFNGDAGVNDYDGTAANNAIFGEGGSGVVINTREGFNSNSITLLSVSNDDLTEDNFIF